MSKPLSFKSEPQAEMSFSWKDKRITVLGLSKSGAAVARYIQRHGGQVFLSESLPATPTNEALRHELQAAGVTVEMGGHSANCYQFADTVITSPGIPPNGSILSELSLSGKEILSEVELAYRESQRFNPPVPMIGVTGTNGKSTTTTLISEILQAAGKNAPACGNIGLPIMSVLDEAQLNPDAQALDFLVAELSSFQLHFSPTLRAKIAVFTNLTPDHLDWHGSLDAYEQDKLRLFIGKQAPEWCVINAEDPFAQKIREHLNSQPGTRLMSFALSKEMAPNDTHRIYLSADGEILVERQGEPMQTLCHRDELQLIGDHNLENVMAAAATALLIGVSILDIKQSCQAFKGLEHRLERVQPLKSPIPFYNDSKATNPESAISALRAFKAQPVILIAGGYDKMTPLEPLVADVAQHASAVVLLGNAQKRFAEAITTHSNVPVHCIEPGPQSLSAAIEKALSLSLEMASASDKPPQPVLFSPACASFDMFKNYEERGRAFKEAIGKLVF